MKIVVNTKKSTIPVEIGDLTFEVAVDDASLERYAKEHAKVAKKLEKVNAKDIDGAKKVLENAYDFFLGNGAFKQVYEAYPSILICADIFMQFLVSFTQEISKLNKPVSIEEIEAQFKASTQ